MDIMRELNIMERENDIVFRRLKMEYEYTTEASGSGEKKEGIIKRMIDSIKKFINGVIDKVTSLFKGKSESQIEKELGDKEVQVKGNPEKELKEHQSRIKEILSGKGVKIAAAAAVATVAGVMVIKAKKANKVKNDSKKLLDEVSSRISNLESQLSGLNDKVENVEANADGALAQSNANKGKIDQITWMVKDLQKEVQGVSNLYGQMANTVNSAIGGKEEDEPSNKQSTAEAKKEEKGASKSSASEYVDMGKLKTLYNDLRSRVGSNAEYKKQLDEFSKENIKGDQITPDGMKALERALKRLYGSNTSKPLLIQDGEKTKINGSRSKVTADTLDDCISSLGMFMGHSRKK